MTRYRNSFHKPSDATYGPEFYETNAKPVEHCGLLIYQRLPKCFDIVDDGVCIGQYAGINGAKNAIETRFGRVTTLRELALGE
jgi:hypothetical protein